MQPEAGKPRTREFWIVCLLIALTGSLLIARLSSSKPLGSANDRSRWCTVWSLAHRGTYQIDEIIKYPGWDTIDKVRHEDHFYSTKPPLFPTTIAGLYWTIKTTTGLTLARDTELVSQLILLIVNIIPYLIAMFWFWKLLVALQYESTARIVTVAMAGLGTLLTAYLTVLNNHTAGATCLIFSLVSAAFLLLRDHDEQDSGPGWLFAICGFFAMLTCCNELPAALFGLAIFALLARHDWKKTAIWFVPAALVPLIAFMVTNYLATGGWKPFYMYYGTEKYVYEYLGVPSYWSDPRGLDKARDSVGQYVFHCLIGHHGIFSLTPLWLLAIPGYWFGLRSKTHSLKDFYYLGLLLTGAILLFYWRRTENYNYGGVSVSLRWVLWLTPFWLLAVAEFFDRLGSLKKQAAVLIVVGVPSLFSAWAPWNTPWQQPWLYNVLAEYQLIDYSDPPEPLPHPIHGWINILPTSPQPDANYWCQFRSVTGKTLRISDGGPQPDQPAPNRLLIVEYADQAGVVTRTRQIIVHADRLREGTPVAQYLLAWKDSDPNATAADQLEFLRGVPEPSYYRPGRFRYLFTPLQENAFRCRQIANRVVIDATETRPKREVRSDLWLAEEIPFGLAQMRITISSYDPKTLASMTTWTAVRAGKKLTVSESADEETSDEEEPQVD